MREYTNIKQEKQQQQQTYAHCPTLCALFSHTLTHTGSLAMYTNTHGLELVHVCAVEGSMVCVCVRIRVRVIVIFISTLDVVRRSTF